MKPGEKGEIIFESTFEARVAAQLLADAGKHHLIRNVEPQIPEAFMTKQLFKSHYPLMMAGKIPDTAQYRCPADESSVILHYLLERANVCGPNQVARNMKDYIGQRIVGYMTMRREREAWGRPEPRIDDGDGLESV
jgi:hypothetical protein